MLLRWVEDDQFSHILHLENPAIMLTEAKEFLRIAGFTIQLRRTRFQLQSGEQMPEPESKDPNLPGGSQDVKPMPSFDTDAIEDAAWFFCFLSRQSAC